MSGTGFLFVSQRIQNEKSLKRLGTAQIRLDVLDFPYSQRLDPDNVERLKRLFRGERGCVPEDVENRIPAIISEARLREALHITGTGISAENLLSDETPHRKLELPDGCRLECLRGRHRAAAAAAVLSSNDKRWVVDLFAAGLNDDAKRDLIEEYANEKVPEDGEFFYKIREYQGEFGTANPYFARRWWARLASISKSTNKTARLKQLIAHPIFGPDFDSLRHLRALYIGLRLSVINKMISMYCPEEIHHSLMFLRKFWEYVFDNNEQDMQRLDVDSVLAFQNTAPGACREDAERLRGDVMSGRLLKGFDPQKRMVYWERLCSATSDCLVPSLFTFFENLKYLQVAADCMKRLVRLRKTDQLGSRDTIRSALERAFPADELDSDFSIQLSDTCIRAVPAAGVDRFDVSYRELWLRAFRDYRDMPAETRKKLAGPKGGVVDVHVLCQFASFAHKKGFSTPEIQDLLQRDPDRETARHFLLTARKPGQYKYEDIETSVTNVVTEMSTAEMVQISEDSGDFEVSESRRPPTLCGIPSYDDHPRDRASMFLHKLHAREQGQMSHITSFFAQRSRYYTFFGKEISVDLVNLGEIMELGLEQETMNHVGRRASQVRIEPQIQQQTVHDDLAREIAARQARADDLERRIQDKENTLALLTQQEAEKRDRIHGLENTALGLTNAEQEKLLYLDKLEQEEEAKRNMLQQLERQCIATRDEIQSDLQDQVVLLQQKLDELRNKERDQLDMLQRLKEDTETAQSSLQLLEKQKRALELAIQNLCSRIQELSIDEQEVLSSISQREGQHHLAIQELTAKESELLGKIKELERPWIMTANIWFETEEGEGEERKLVRTLDRKFSFDRSDTSEPLMRMLNTYGRLGYRARDSDGRVIPLRACADRVRSGKMEGIVLFRPKGAERDAAEGLTKRNNRRA